MFIILLKKMNKIEYLFVKGNTVYCKYMPNGWIILEYIESQASESSHLMKITYWKGYQEIYYCL